jgi:hypothetical protein
LNTGVNRSYDGVVSVSTSTGAWTLHRETAPPYGASGLVGHATESTACEHTVRARPAPKLLERVRVALRIRHRSRKTERAYVGWIGRFILLNAKRHPAEMGAAEVERFSRASSSEAPAYLAPDAG